MTVALLDNVSRKTHQVEGSELRRYLRIVVIAGALCMAFVGFTGGVLLTELAQSIGAGDGFYGWLNAAPYIGMAVQLPVSRLIERTGRRRWMFIADGSCRRDLLAAAAVAVAGHYGCR